MRSAPAPAPAPHGAPTGGGGSGEPAATSPRVYATDRFGPVRVLTAGYLVPAAGLAVLALAHLLATARRAG